jgi:hypothetical protein
MKIITNIKKSQLSVSVLAALLSLSPAASQTLMVANFEGSATDRMCDNRFSRYTSGGVEAGAHLEVAANPAKTPGYNASGNVLRVYDVNYTGCIHLNLTTGIAGSNDKLDISGYNALRLKYRVNSPETFGALNAIVKLNGANPAIPGVWSNTDKEWKTVSFTFPSQQAYSRIQIFLYYGAGWSANAIDGLEIFIDDVEFYYESDATARLSSIRVDGEELEFFHVDSLSYTVYYPYNYPADNVPLLTCVQGNAGQTVAMQPATSLTGSLEERTATITVTEGDDTNVYKVVYEKVPELDIFLCLGQSNMSGYGEILSQDKGIIANTFLLTPKAGFIAATNPLNRFSTIANSVAKISPAYGFALGMQGKTAHPVGLLVNARNGSSIEMWAKGNTATPLYDKTVERAREAMKWGTVKGIVWHQGESNSYDPVAYKPKLTALVNNFRSDLGIPGLFFVAGELGYWRQNGTGSTAWNAMIRTISTFINNSDWVSAEDLTFYLDATDPHFSRESAVALGRRYAEKMLSHVYGQSSAETVPAKDPLIAIENRGLVVGDIPENCILAVYDVCGSRLFTSPVSAFSAPFTFRQAGVYLLSLNISGKVSTRKVIVK